MLRPSLMLTTIAALLAGPAATAAADTVIAPAPRAVELTAGGGYLAWMAPAEGSKWKLVVRGPDGEVERPDIESFARPQQIAIGSAASPAPGRDVTVTYVRPSGGDDDVYLLNLRTGEEERVGPISSRAYDESLPVQRLGTFVFARKGGRRDGIYRWRPGSGAERVTGAVPRRLATNGSRVAYVTGRRIVLRRFARRDAYIRFTSPRTVRDLTLTRYRVGWLIDGGHVFQSSRFGSGQPSRPTAETGRRQLPERTRAIADDGAEIDRYLDAAGVKRIEPGLF